MAASRTAIELEPAALVGVLPIAENVI